MSACACVSVRLLPQVLPESLQLAYSGSPEHAASGRVGER
jgi:hypothetical protein